MNILHARQPQRRTQAGALALALAGTLALTACQSLPVEPQIQERSVLLQRMDAVVQGAQAASALRLTSQPDPVTTGQTVTVDITNTQAGYLYLYQVATDGKTLNLVFPNAVDGANYLQPGATRLPRVSWQLRAQGPAGLGYLVAVMTPEPLNLLKVQMAANAGQFTVDRAYAAASTTLREIAPQ